MSKQIDITINSESLFDGADTKAMENVDASATTNAFMDAIVSAVSEKYPDYEIEIGNDEGALGDTVSIYGAGLGYIETEHIENHVREIMIDVYNDGEFWVNAK